MSLPQSPARHWLPEPGDLPAIATLALVYACIAWACLDYFAIYAHSVTLIWPPSGLALAVLLVRGPRLWPGIALGAFTANALSGLAVLPALAIAAGNTAEAAVGFWLLAGASAATPNLDNLRSYWRLMLLGAAVACAVAASSGTLTLTLSNAADGAAFTDVWLAWWMGDSLGVALITPLVLAWVARDQEPTHPAATRWLHLLGFVGTLLAVSALVLLGPIADAPRGHGAALAIFPLLIWAALGFGRLGASLTALVIAAMAILSATLKVGHFAQEMQEAGMFNVWLQTLFAAITGMTVATLVDERQRSEDALKRNRQQLAESEANFRSLAESAPVLIWVSGLDQRCNWFNRAWLEFTGRSLEQEMGDGWAQGVHPEDMDHCLMIYRSAFAAQRPFSMEYRLRNRHGEYRWIVDHGAPRHDDAGRFLGYSGACWDVSEQHTAVVALKEREKLLRTIYDASSVAIFLVDRHGRITMANQRMAEMFGWPLTLLVGTDYVDHIQPDERETARAKMLELMAGEMPEVDLERLYQRRDGGTFWGHLTGRPLLDHAGQLKGLVGVIADIDRRRQAEDQLRLAGRIIEASSEGILVSDRNNRILTVNKTFCDITGYAQEEIVGLNPGLLASGRQDSAFYAGLWQCLARDGRWSGEIWNRRKNGEIYPEWLSIFVLRDDDGAVTNYVAIFTDITERKEIEERIRHMAEHDHLTGLPNRVLLFDRTTQLHATATRYGRRFAVLFIDLDNFKPVNDAYGHEAGDSLLRVVACRLRQNVRAADTAARYGGDEFVVLVPEVADTDEVAQLAEKLLGILSAPYHVDGMELRITPSIGVAIYPDHGSDVDTLMRHADAAMYRAKDAGRNRVHFHNSVGSRLDS